VSGASGTGWREELARRLRGRVAVVGVGNDLRGDDGAGPALARSLAERVGIGEGWLVLDCGEVPENYLGPILAAEPETILLCDAADFGGRAGEVRVLELGGEGAPPLSTHNASLRLLGSVLTAESGAEVALVGIQPAWTSWGAPLSEAVAASVTQVADALSELLRQGPN
jgi:hydrogenase 3 maturation protease